MDTRVLWHRARSIAAAAAGNTKLGRWGAVSPVIDRDRRSARILGTIASMIDADTVMIEEPGQLALRCGAVLVWATAGALEDAPFDQVREALETMAVAQPQGVALLLVSLGTGELPKLRTRRRIAGGLSSLGERLQAVAAVFEGGKPWLARARATIEGMFTEVETTMLGKLGGAGGLPMQLFSDRVDGIVWLGEVVVGPDQRPIETGALAALVDEACAQVLRK